MNVVKRVLLSCALICIAPLAANARTTVDRTIARLNSEILTESDLTRVIGERLGAFGTARGLSIDRATSDDIAALLDRTLLVAAAKARNITPTESELQQQVESMVSELRTNFRTEAEFRQALAEEQLSLEELKSILLKRARNEFQVYHLVRSRFSVTESDARAFEAQCTAQGQAPVSVRLRRLAVPVKGKDGGDKAAAEVREIAAKILANGLSFEEGIRKYSKVPGAELDGGDLGYLALDKLDSRVAAAVRDLQIGQATSPIVTGGFANIFYLEGKQGARGLLVERKFTEHREVLLRDLRRKATLQVFDQRLMKALPQDYRAAVKSKLNTTAAQSVTENTPPRKD